MAKTKGNCAQFLRYNGTAFEQISQVYSISGIEIEKEEIEDDSFLECTSALIPATTRAFTIKSKEAGSASLSNPTLELAFDPEQAATNEALQNLLMDDIKSGNQTYYMITLANGEASGFIFYGTPKKWALSDISPDETIKSSWEFIITQAVGDLGWIYEDDISNVVLPASPVAVIA